MQYRSIQDMNVTILKNLHHLPRDIELVVGVPRSGLLAANLLALLENVRMTDLDSYLEGRVYSTGTTKTHSLRTTSSGPRKVLILDDSISTGSAMKTVRQRVEEAKLDDTVIYAAVYGITSHHPETDLVFEVVSQPRVFQWNFMHHVTLERASRVQQKKR